MHRRDYLRRLEFYRQRIWTCSATGKSGLSYEEALTSEAAARSLAQPVRLRRHPEHIAAAPTHAHDACRCCRCLVRYAWHGRPENLKSAVHRGDGCSSVPDDAPRNAAPYFCKNSAT